jgi:L-asparaginase
LWQEVDYDGNEFPSPGQHPRRGLSSLPPRFGPIVAKPQVFIAATGGTIAGVQKSVEQHGYTAGELGVAALVEAVPQLKDIADVRGEQIVNIPSQDMTDAVWLQLARRLQELEQSSDVTGIVVTHGTDTLEETSFFVELTVDTPKPIVFTGSMRPATR